MLQDNFDSFFIGLKLGSAKYGGVFFPCDGCRHAGVCFLGFSRMRSKGSRFTLGVWGLRVCSLDVAFTVATVRNRPQPFA